MNGSGIAKERKYIVFESQLMQLFQRCHSCGLEVKLETSVRGTLLVVNGICPDGHVLYVQMGMGGKTNSDVQFSGPDGHGWVYVQMGMGGKTNFRG